MNLIFLKQVGIFTECCQAPPSKWITIAKGGTDVTFTDVRSLPARGSSQQPPGVISLLISHLTELRSSFDVMFSEGKMISATTEIICSYNAIKLI